MSTNEAQLVTMQHSPTTVPAPISEVESILSGIVRAASDPAVDVDKFERLMGMYERITANKAKATFDAALSAMQPELPVVDRRGKIVIRDKNDRTTIIQSTPYALFEDINEAIGPVMARHGFAVSFRVGLAQDGKITVTGILSHREGHREETMIALPHDSTGSKNSVQAIGSSTSYGKRYTLCALLNITTRGEDDDGKKAGDPEFITPEQVERIQLLIVETGSDIQRYCKHMKVARIEEITVKKFDDAIAALEAKGKRA